MKIKAIFCDLGGVLLLANKDKREEYKEKGITREVSVDIFAYILTGKRTEEEINSCLEKYGVKRELWDSFVEEVFYLGGRNNDLYTLLKKAKDNGVMVVYTTNHTSNLQEIMARFEIADLPDIIMNSSEMGVVKPDDKFWEMSLLETKKLKPDLMPAEVLVIDDSEKNCASAIKNGMQAVIYRDNDSDIEILKTLGY